MKIKPWEVDGFIRRPAPDVIAALFFGRDEGLIRERAATLGRGIVEDLKDPFRVAELTVGDLSEDPARLGDEAAAISMTGGRRLIRVDRATDGLASVFESFLRQPRGDGFVLVIAGDLAGRSKLRKLFETSKIAVALPCYPDEARALEGLISEVLGGHGLSADRAAADFLVAHLGSDRMVSRGELEKLALYKADGGGGTEVTLEDASACIGDSAALGLDQAANAALAGDLTGLETALARAADGGQNPISALRILTMRVQRLHRLAGLTGRGLSTDAALKKLRPPAFSREAKTLAANLRRWPMAKLVRALEIVMDAELACKTTGAPAQAICARAYLTLAVAARR